MSRQLTMRRTPAIASFVLALAVTPARADPSTASGTRVHVRGTARIEAHASRASGRLVLRGTLTDDASAPLEGQSVAITLSGDPPLTGGGAASGAVAPFTCAFGADDHPSALPFDGHKILVPTDAGGHFCMQAGVAMGRYLARIDWRGSPWLDGARAEVAVDLAKKPVTLAFAPEPNVVRVDDDLTVNVLAMIEEEGAREPAASLQLVLSDERGSLLGSAVTGGAGRATFTVDAARLGPPGKGELRASFDGTSVMGKAAHVAPIERRARVALRMGPADRAHTTGAPDALPAVDSDEASSFSVSVRTSRGAVVPRGSVEVLVGNLVVCAATVESGEARLVVNVGPGNGTVPLRVRYAPDAPWYTPGDELSLSLPVRGASPWRKAPVLLAGLAVIAWLVAGRRSKGRIAKADDTETAKAPSLGEARIDVLRSVKSARAGWTGRVIDAHAETAVASAQVSLERRSFRGVSVMATAQANAAGRFELRCEDLQPGDALAVEAPLHAVLRKPVPPFGEIQIALVLRRRKLLSRLVAWARARGKPFDHHPEPTPGHVKRAAGKDEETARWAEALERAAFGAEQVDGEAEKAVVDLEPGPTGRNPR